MDHMDNLKSQVDPINLSPTDEKKFLNAINKVTTMKWHAEVTLVIAKELLINSIALIDTEANVSCVSEGLVPTNFFHKTSTSLYATNAQKLEISYKLSDAAICSNGLCINHSFLLIKGLNIPIIIRTDFLTELIPFSVTQKGLFSDKGSEQFCFKFISSPKELLIDCLNHQKDSKVKY